MDLNTEHWNSTMDLPRLSENIPAPNIESNLPKNDQLSDNKIAEEVRSNPMKDIQPVKLAKKAKNPPTSHMVLEAIKSLKMRKGATVEAIRQEIESTHIVVGKSFGLSLKRFLKTGLEKGLLDHVGGTGDKSRFKIKKNETFKKEKPNLKERTKQLEAKKTGKQLEAKKTGKQLEAKKTGEKLAAKKTGAKLEEKKTGKKLEVKKTGTKQVPTKR